MTIRHGKRIVAGGCAAALALAGAVLAFGGGAGSSAPGHALASGKAAAAAGEIVLGGEGAAAGPTAAERAAAERRARAERSRARSVGFTGLAGSGVWVDPEDSHKPASRPQSDADIRAELKDFRRYLARVGGLEGPRAKVLPDGRAVAPSNAPAVVKQVIQAANAIADTPYKWGGGHAGWEDTGYDCSGSVSFALAGAGLLGSPLASGGFLDWGEQGEGEWITIYTNPGHMFMVVAGLRFDTSGRQRAGTRWQSDARSTAGLEARHYPGL